MIAGVDRELYSGHGVSGRRWGVRSPRYFFPCRVVERVGSLVGTALTGQWLTIADFCGFLCFSDFPQFLACKKGSRKGKGDSGWGRRKKTR